MKKVIIILLSLAALIAGVTVAVLRTSGEEKKGLDGEAYAFARKAATEMTESWDYTVLLRYASPELRAAVPEGTLAGLFVRSSEGLGKVRRYYSCEGTVTVKGLADSRAITGAYTVNFGFERGDAGIKMELVKKDDKWYVNRFYVVAPGGI